MPRAILRRDEAAMQGAAWTPALLQRDLAAWFDFSDPASLSWGTGISQARSLDGRGSFVEQSSAGFQPSLTMLGNRVAMLGAAGRRLSGLASPDVSLGNSFMAVVAARIDGRTGANARVFSCAPAGQNDWNNGGAVALIVSSAPNTITTDFNGARSATSIVPDRMPAVISVTCHAGALAHFVGGAPGGTGTLSGLAIGNVRWLFSAEITTSSSAQILGATGEAVVLRGAQPAPVRQALEGYIAWRWGISLRGDHRFANRPPVRGE